MFPKGMGHVTPTFAGEVPAKVGPSLEGAGDSFLSPCSYGPTRVESLNLVLEPSDSPVPLAVLGRATDIQKRQGSTCGTAFELPWDPHAACEKPASSYAGRQLNCRGTRRRHVENQQGWGGPHANKTGGRAHAVGLDPRLLATL